MNLNSEQVWSIIWGVCGIIGCILFFSSTLHGKGVKRLPFIIGVGLIVLAIYSLSMANQGFANGLTLLAALGAVFMALMSMKQTEMLEVKHDKEAVLKEIMDWVIEIQNIPWMQMKNFDVKKYQNPLEEMARQEIILYAHILTKNDYIKKLSEKAFDGKLKESVKELNDNLIKYMYLEYKITGVEKPDRLFGGEWNSLVLSFEKEASEKNKSNGELLVQYGFKLPQLANNVVIKIAEVKVSLISD